MVASETLKNDFAEQMFTLQLSNILPRTILKKKCLIAKRMMRWERGWQIKLSYIHLIYCHFYSFATGMTNVSPSIFISNVLLKNPTERNA